MSGKKNDTVYFQCTELSAKFFFSLYLCFPCLTETEVKKDSARRKVNKTKYQAKVLSLCVSFYVMLQFPLKICVYVNGVKDGANSFKIYHNITSTNESTSMASVAPAASQTTLKSHANICNTLAKINRVIAKTSMIYPAFLLKSNIFCHRCVFSNSNVTQPSKLFTIGSHLIWFCIWC